jgi:hypothetical protein
MRAAALQRKARTRRLRVHALAALALTLVAPGPLRAQESLPARMNAFVAALEDYAREELAGFFPREGAWTWVLTTHHEGRDDRTGRWRFETRDLAAAMDYPGPLCETFSQGGDAITMGTLMYTVTESRDEEGVAGRWRHAGGTRFVPPDASPRSPVFVQWRREAGRWVVDAIGDERFRGPRLPGVEPNSVVRDPGGLLEYPLPADAPYAAGAEWYEQNGPIAIDGERLIKYGLPRRLEAGIARRFGTINGVAVHVEVGTRGTPEVVYVAASPEGMFQPYQDTIGTGCP